MDDPFAPLPASTDPVPPAAPVLARRRPSDRSALRAGMILGAALVVAIGTAVAMGASPAPTTSGAGPIAAASPSARPDKGRNGNGFGHGGFGGFGPSTGGFGPFAGGRDPGGSPGRGFGRVTIAAIDGSKLSLTTGDGWTRTITITSATTITRGGAAATAADLHVGDAIRFRQHRNADGSFTIDAVDIVLPEVVGTITGTTSDSITITTRDGTSLTVHLGSATRIAVRGVGSATAKDLKAGQVVLVVGSKRADGSIDATGVLAGKLRGPGFEKPNAGRPDRSDDPDESPGPSGQAG